MLNITFKGEPYLFVGDSLEDSGAIATMKAFVAGEVSFAHYYPDGEGRVLRYGDQIGTRADLVVLGPAEDPEMTFGDLLGALDNMLGGDPGWDGPPAVKGHQ